MKTSKLPQAFPDSLVEWAPHDVLVALTLESVERCEDQAGAEDRWPGKDYAGFQSKLLLSLATYSYAIGIYGSEDIVSQLRRDPGLAYLSAGSQPDWNLLRRFRRENKEAIARCLEYLFKLVWIFRFEQDQSNEVDWDICDVMAVHDWFAPELTASLQELTHQRILWSIQSDTAFLDA